MCLLCALAAAGTAGGPAAPGPFPALAEPFPWPSGRPAGVRFTWTGVAGILLEAEGVRIAFDPFASRPGVLSTLFRRTRPDAAAVARAFPRLDAVCVGHAHHDHAMDVGLVAEASPRAVATLR